MRNAVWDCKWNDSPTTLLAKDFSAAWMKVIWNGLSYWVSRKLKSSALQPNQQLHRRKCMYLVFPVCQAVPILLHGGTHLRLQNNPTRELILFSTFHRGDGWGLELAMISFSEAAALQFYFYSWFKLVFHTVLMTSLQRCGKQIVLYIRSWF